MVLWSACTRKFIVLFLLIGLTACSSSSERKAIYEKKAEHDMSLEVPPDLEAPENNALLDIPAIATTGATFSSFSDSRQSNTGSVLGSVSADARIVRDGSMQWLEIKAKADDIWIQLMAFFRNEGFEIVVSDTRLGLMETDWQENRVDVPTSWLSRLLSKIYDSGLKDKYRARLEKADGFVRVFLTHRGLEEKATDDLSNQVVETYWEVRDPDPELEAEMMQRFLVFRGLDKNQAKSIVRHKDIQERAILKQEADTSYLLVSENFPRSWRRTGLALDRLGLLVEDRNRSAGMYYIKITEEFIKAHEEQQGWFESLFSSKDKSKPDSYIIKLADMGETTRVTLLDRDGKATPDEASKLLLNQLQRYLR